MDSITYPVPEFTDAEVAFGARVKVLQAEAA